MKLVSSSSYKAVVHSSSHSRKLALSFTKKNTDFILRENEPLFLVKILETEQINRQIRDKKQVRHYKGDLR